MATVCLAQDWAIRFRAAVRLQEFGVNQDFRLFVCDYLLSLPALDELFCEVRLEP